MTSSSSYRGARSRTVPGARVPNVRSVERLRGPALIVGAAVLWGTTGTAQALGPDGADPLGVGAVRLLLGGVALLAAGLAGGGRRNVRDAVAARRLPPGYLAATVAGVAAYQPLFFTGVREAGVALGTVVAIGSAPVITGLLARVVDGERLTPRWAAATAAGVAGVVLVGGGASAGGGIVFPLGAAFSYAVYATGAKRLVAALAPRTAMGLAFGGGALALGLLVLVPGAPLAADVSWVGSPRGAATAAWLGLVTTAAAYLLFGEGLARTRVSTAATLSLAEPLTALLLGVAVLGERPPAAAWAGAALIVAGLALAAGEGPAAPAVTPG